jgi:uncharacterized protein YdhG (YjbR/CyaY superfamily)
MRVRMVAGQQLKTIDAYIASCPAAVQPVLGEMRQTIREVMPDATEAMSYQIPTFKLKGRNIVHFAAWKSHVSVYPIPAGDEEFDKQLAPYKKGKGTLQFPLGKPIPQELLKKLVQLRLEEERPKGRRQSVSNKG